MKIPLALVEKFILLQSGDKIPASRMSHHIVNEMLENGILKKQIQGRSKASISLPDRQTFDLYIQNHYGIADLQNYTEAIRSESLTRADAISVSSDSKLKKIRTFKGFLVNCYTPVQAKLNGKEFLLRPTAGAFHFIYDFETFEIPKELTIVGVENPENFRHIEKQKHLFNHITPLFISRYPQNQSKDLLNYLQSIPNSYLHFGDFDFAGIAVYLHEYKKHLAGKASFFVPENIESTISKYGNSALYDKQKLNFDFQSINEQPLIHLVNALQRHKKALEQEIFITTGVTYGSVEALG